MVPIGFRLLDEYNFFLLGYYGLIYFDCFKSVVCHVRRLTSVLLFMFHFGSLIN